MRPECLECVAKHLAKAQINLDEALMGYPAFIHKVLGNMDEAASEMLRIDSIWSNNLRDIRLKLWDGWWAYRTGKISPAAFAEEYAPDFDTLLDDIDERILADQMLARELQPEEEDEQ